MLHVYLLFGFWRALDQLSFFIYDELIKEHVNIFAQVLQYLILRLILDEGSLLEANHLFLSFPPAFEHTMVGLFGF